MESLPRVLSPFHPLLKPISPFPSSSKSNHTHLRYAARAALVPRNQTVNPDRRHNLPLKTQLSLAVIELITSLPCSAAETLVPNEQVSDRINLESIVVSIDDFFNRYPFFVAGCTFVWLFVWPVTREYLEKYKFISAINAFNKLKSDPNAQLLDVRDGKSLASLRSPSLKIFNKSVVQIEYGKEDEDGFVKNVMEKFSDPTNTSIFILDNLGDDSIMVAELLSKNGFKVAYAIKGGVKGKKGWLTIQETLLPPSVHILGKNKAKAAQELETNGGAAQQSERNDPASSASVSVGESQKKIELGHGDISTESTQQIKVSSRSSSPYPNYPDLKPPSSPTPSKPQH